MSPASQVDQAAVLACMLVTAVALLVKEILVAVSHIIGQVVAVVARVLLLLTNKAVRVHLAVSLDQQLAVLVAAVAAATVQSQVAMDSMAVVVAMANVLVGFMVFIHSMLNLVVTRGASRLAEITPVAVAVQGHIGLQTLAGSKDQDTVVQV
jgi:hypothetical protein